MNISRKTSSIGVIICVLTIIMASLCGLFVSVKYFFRESQILGVIILLYSLFWLVFSVAFIYSCILGVETRFTDTEIQKIRRGCVINSIKWDDYRAAYLKRGIYGNVTVTLFPLYHTKIVIKKMTVAEMRREGVYQFVLLKWFVYSKDGSEVVHFIERKYGTKL